jgi:gliding motility-associated-like protein
VATLQLTVNNTGLTNQSRSVCRSQLPLSWNGLTINQAGSYTRTLTGVAGCDSTVSLVLTVTDTAFSNTRISLCAGDVPYVWNGNSYSVSGIYRKSFTAASGCDSVAVLDLLVRNPILTEQSSSVCANELPYRWQSLLLTESGNYADTLADVNGCDSVLRLSFTVYPVPLAPRLGNDTLICSGERFDLRPGIYSSYRWQDNSTASIYTVSAPGTYHVRVADANGCSLSDTIQVGLVANCADIVFPTGFSPNNDGLNDRFGPLGNLSLISDYRLTIFNRYGQAVFNSNNPFQKWEASDSQYLPGAYTWISTYRYRKDMRRTQRGTVMLVR